MKNIQTKESSESITSESWSEAENEAVSGHDPLQIYTDHRLYHSRLKWFWQFSYFIDKIGEARGVQRELPENRTKADYKHFLRLAGIWMGATCSIPSMTGFFLGSLSFQLSFKAAVSSSVVGCFLGSVIGAFGAPMGPRSGLRSMMGVKYQFGWWFGKILCLLNCLTLIGWLIVNGNFGGQLLSALTDERISVQIGILILFLVVLVVSVFGIQVLSLFDTFFAIPIFVAFLLCYVCTGPEFVVDKPSKITGVDLRAAWVSNLQACIGITSTWLPVASDYNLDLPEKVNKVALYLFTLAIIFIPTAFVGILGCGIASAGLYNLEKAQIYEKFGGAGLIVEGMKKWHGGGKFIAVLIYISLITNGVLTCYSFGLSFQTLGRPIARFPRYILVILGSVIWYVLAAVGQSGWSEVISNFLPMIGYWSLIYGAILIIEMLWFRRNNVNEIRWDQYLNPKHFPIMYAAMLSAGFGVAGVVLGMDQYYYKGRLAGLIGSGCELGSFLAFGFSAVSYFVFRSIEIRLRRPENVFP